MYRDVLPTKAESKSFVTTEQGEYEECEEIRGGNDSNTLLIRAGKAGRKNKPGVEVSAIRNS